MRHRSAIASISSDYAAKVHFGLAWAWTAPPSARIKFVDRVLPFDDLVLEPDPAVRADVSRSRKAACLLHPVKRGAADRHDLQNLLFAQHASRRGLCRCAVFRFDFLSPRCDHRELLTISLSVGPPQNLIPSRSTRMSSFRF